MAFGLGIGAVRAEEAKATVQGIEDDDLRKLVQTSIGEVKEGPKSRFEARRRAREAGDTTIAVLRSEGYYDYTVEADIVDPDDEDGGAPPQAIVKVTVGPRFRIANPKVDWLEPSPSPQVRSAGQLAMALRRGATGRAADVVAAESRVLTAVQNRGYADAEVEPREVVVDHADDTVRPTYRIQAGDLVKLDGVVIKGLKRTDEAWAQKLTPWKPGDTYDPTKLAELQSRFQDTGAYNSVSVTLAPKDQLNPDGTRPVILQLDERSKRSLEVGVGYSLRNSPATTTYDPTASQVGAGYSTSNGFGLDVTWTRYNLRRRADTTTWMLILSEKEQRLNWKVARPHWLEPRQTLTTTAGIYNVQTDAYDQNGIAASVDVTRNYGTYSYLTVGVGADAGQSAEPAVVGNTVVKGQSRNIATLSLLGAYAVDKSNDVLDPTRGWRVEVRAEPTATFGDIQREYFKLQAQGTYYHPFDSDGRMVLAGRLKAGSLIGVTNAFDVPASRRFYSGGGGSVRGYSYQAIGPRLPDNTPQGGISLLEASLEYRQKIGEHWGFVAFVDGGAVGAESTPTGDDFSAGAGVGVRYDLGFGPIRADIAVPLNKRQGDPGFQIYISIGQSF